MQRWKNFKYKEQCELGFILISYVALLVFLFLNGTSIKQGLEKLNSLLNPFFYGFVIAYLVNPITRFIEVKVLANRSIKFKQFNVHRLISIVVSYFIVLTFIFICSIYVIPQLIDSISNIMTSIPDAVTALEDVLKSQKDNLGAGNSKMAHYIDTCSDSLYLMIDSWVSQVSNYLPKVYDFILGITLWLKDLLLGVFISIYMLFYKEKFVMGLKRTANVLLSKNTVENTTYVLKKSDEVFGGFIIAKALDSLIIGILTYVCCLIFNIPYSMLISVIVGITNMIPVFGPIIGGVIGLALLVLVDMRAFWIFAILIFIIQQLDGNVIGPKIVGAKLGLASIWVMFGVIVVGGLFGVSGFFIGVPIFAVVYTLCKEYVIKREKIIEEENKNNNLEE